MKLMKKMIVALLCLVLVLGVSGCGKLNISREIAKVEGRVITEAEFKFYLENVKSQMLSEAGEAANDENFWETEKDGVKFSDLAKDKAMNEAVRVELACIKAEELGLSVNAETVKAIDQMFSGTDSNQKEAIKSIEKETGLFERLYKEMMMKSALAYEYQNNIMLNEADKITPADDEINAEYENKYVRVKHVLLQLGAEDAETASDAEPVDAEALKAEKKALADEIAEKAKNGTRFESLIEEFGEDPGMQSNPDGYTFAQDGSMVPEFEEAAFNMEIGEVSEPVEVQSTNYQGFHILKKYPLLTSGEEYEQIKTTISQELSADKYEAMIDEFKADYTIEIKSNIVNKTKVK